MRAKILLVDDRPQNLFALRAILDTLECDFVEAASGTEALKHLLKREFALILMDVQMPGLDGFETATIIKEREKSRHIPIIFVTAISKEQDYVFQGYSAGAVDYIFKPFNPDILRSKVAVFIDLWQKTEQIKRQGELERRNQQLELQQRHYVDLVLAKETAERERASAERANRAKSDFIAGISHELRTPLNAIIGFSKLLLNPRVGPLNEDQAAYTKDVVQSAEHLLQLINDILDLSKIEAGKMSLDLDTFDVTDLLEQCLVVVRENAAARNLHLKVDLSPEVTQLPPIVGDARKVKQVMFNLLSNAVKFTPDGSITVTASCEPPAFLRDTNGATKLGTAQLFVSVQDTGVGIAEEHQSRIFSAFEQVDNSYTRQQQGTGLGLALTRRIVELHGGGIWLHSAVGLGSTFAFSLPLERNESPTIDGELAPRDRSDKEKPCPKTKSVKKISTAKRKVSSPL